MEDHGLIFAGNLFIGDVVDGVVSNLRGPINVPKFEITPPTVDTKTRKSYKRDTYGQALDTVNLPNESSKLSIGFDTMETNMFADALGGTVADASVAEQTVSAAVVTLNTETWVMLQFDNLNQAGFTIEKSSDNTPLVVGTDVEVDFTSGLVRALTAGAAVEVSIDYTTAAKTGSKVLGATEPFKNRYFLLDGKNLATQKRCKVQVWQATLSATAAADLMSSEYFTGQLDGTLNTPSTKASPYEVDVYS